MGIIFQDVDKTVELNFVFGIFPAIQKVRYMYSNASKYLQAKAEALLRSDSNQTQNRHS